MWLGKGRPVHDIQGSLLTADWFVLVAQSCPTFCFPWTEDHQAPLPMEFSRQEYWSRLPFPSPGNLSDPRTEPKSSALQAASLPSEP